MVGNAVPVKLAEAIAKRIMSDMKTFSKATEKICAKD
jgi:site-specific DNA-cytosine methylase